MLRCLFGPASLRFAQERFSPTGQHRLFDVEAHQEFSLPVDGTWDDLARQFPQDWQPDCLALWLAYSSIPPALWNAPVPIIGLAADWNLHWHLYRQILHRCDVVLTDAPGVEALRNEGLTHVRAANLYGLGPAFGEPPMECRVRDIDVLFVGNLNPAVQHRRLNWLGRLARLSLRRKIVIRTGVFGEEYRELLGRAKIVFNHSIRSECNQRVFEAVAGGALLLQERDNTEVPFYLQPGAEYADYDEHDLESVIEHILTDDNHRQSIVDAARAKLPSFSFTHLWDQALNSLEPEWKAIQDQARERVESPYSPDWKAGIWSVCCGGNNLEFLASFQEAPKTANKVNAAGILARDPAEAAELFAEALKHNPGHAVAGLNRVEALIMSGNWKEAIAQATQTLALVERSPAFRLDVLDAPHYPAGFDLFRVEWERTGWSNAGNPEAQQQAKRQLLLCWLHSLLADLTGDLEHFEAAGRLRPDLGIFQAAWGCALARHGRFEESSDRLQRALKANPFDLQAERALYQVLSDEGKWVARSELFSHQLDLRRSAPQLITEADWLQNPPLSGQERTSIIVLGCNQVELTRLCLESVLRNTAGDYELILVDNGSTDETLQYFEEMRNRPGPARVEVIHNKQNRGFSGGVNQGLAVAQGEFLVLLNNDTIVTPNWLTGLIEASLTNWPKVGMVGPMTNYTAAPQQVVPGYQDLSGLDAFALQRQEQFAGQVVEQPRITGFCLLIRRAVLEKIGGKLDERFGLGFFEDDDLCYAARRAGFKLAMVPSIYIHHFGSQTFAGLGIDTAKQLSENFQRFKDKWGSEAAAHYRFPSVAGQESTIVSDHRPRMSLCMIVKNEEQNLADCLEPIRAIVDEIVVVDTGSTDGTRELARNLGASVIESPWQDSFSAARNVAIEHAKGGWIFWLDADDRITPENVTKLQNLFASLDTGNRAYVMKCRCVASAPGETATVVDHVRLFRNDPRLRWRYRVHEQILPAIRSVQGQVQWTDVEIQHVGYTDPVLRGKKLERDIRLLNLEHAEQPNDPFILFNLGSVYVELNRYSEALPMLRRSLENSHPKDSIVRKLYSLIVQCQRHLGQFEEAIRTCSAGRTLYPQDAELLFVMAGLLRDKGHRKGAEQHYLELIAGHDEEHFGSVASGLRGHKARHNLGLIYLEEKCYSAAEEQWRAVIMEEPAFFPAYVGLGEALLMSQNWPRFDEHLQALRQFGPQGEEEAEVLVGRAKMERQEFAEARRHFQSAVERFPQSISLHVLHTHAILKEGIDERAAEKALLEVLSLAPDHVESKNNLAILRARREDDGTKPSRIFFLCPDNDIPSGGVRRIYRHVDVLCAHGESAFVVHEKPGFRCGWFHNETPVKALSQVRLKPTDFLVVPEIYGPNLADIAPGVPKVIFNQNAYFTFRGWPPAGLLGVNPYRHREVMAILAVSEDNAEYLRYAVPDLDVRRVHYSIDPLFAPCWPKQKKMAFMPRKNSADLIQVLNILRSRGSLDGWDLVSIDGHSEQAVADRLRDCAIFLSFGQPEGCPLPPMEAMASGCVAIGYHGRGGREYFNPKFSYPVEVGDVVGFAKAVEEALRKETEEPGTLEQMGRQAMEFIHANYSPQQEIEDIMEFWRSMLQLRKVSPGPNHQLGDSDYSRLAS